MTTNPAIGIIGCGTVGACMVAALAASADRLGPHDLVLIDEEKDRWRGRAYQHDTSAVLANGPMAGMSLHAGDAQHGVRWAERHGFEVGPDSAGEHRFLPRPAYGDYVEDGVTEALRLLVRAGWRIRSVGERATGLEAGRDQVTVSTARHRLTLTYAVLCLGGRADADPYRLRGTPGYVHDPYPLERALADLPEAAEVAVLGSGMIATDVLMALRDRRHRGPITVLSRSGIMPSVRRNVTTAQARVLTRDGLAATGTGELSLAEIARLAETEVRDAGGDFRALAADVGSPLPAEQRLRRQLAAVASPDPGPQLLQRAVVEVGQDLWLRLPPQDQERVLRTYHTQLWSFASTIPRVTAAHVARMFGNGQLRLHAGLSSAAPAAGGGFLVGHQAGTSRADVVVNAITSVRRAEPPQAQPLLDSMRAAGLVTDHRFGGIAIEPATGRAVPAPGGEGAPIYALGELTRGTYYLVSLVAAFTRRAQDIVADIVASAPSPSPSSAPASRYAASLSGTP